MRIIGGSARGGKLKAPAGYKTRPTSDRVREAIFDMLPHNMTGMKALDLFSGSGAMGIEALSRGADSAVFVESSAAVCGIVRRNLESFGFLDKAEIIRGVLPKAIKSNLGENRKFDVIFIDPPYEKGLSQDTLLMVSETDKTAENGYVAVEHSSKEETPDKIGVLIKIKSKRYGSTAVSIYQREK